MIIIIIIIIIYFFFFYLSWTRIFIFELIA